MGPAVKIGTMAASLDTRYENEVTRRKGHGVFFPRRLLFYFRSGRGLELPLCFYGFWVLMRDTSVCFLILRTPDRQWGLDRVPWSHPSLIPIVKWGWLTSPCHLSFFSYSIVPDRRLRHGNWSHFSSESRTMVEVISIPSRKRSVYMTRR